MKASQVIEKIQKLIEEHGDLEVKVPVSDMDINYDAPVDDIHILQTFKWQEPYIVIENSND